MDIKLIPDFSAGDIKAITDDFIRRVVKITQNELMQIGLEFVTEARSKVPSQEYRDAINGLAYAKHEQRAIIGEDTPGFNDITGNLRSSIFFVLGLDGDILEENFEESARGTDKGTGLEEGKIFATTILKENPKGWVLATGAAMEYAAWVEAKGYDVITGSTLGAKAKLQGVMDRVLLAFE